jgi:hypothetical protein
MVFSIRLVENPRVFSKVLIVDMALKTVKKTLKKI